MFQWLDDFGNNVISTGSRLSRLVFQLVVRPATFWAFVRDGYSPSSERLSGFQCVAWSVLIAHIVWNIHLGNSVNVNPSDFLDFLVNQWPFLIHLACFLLLATLNTSAIKRIFDIPSDKHHAVDCFSFYLLSGAIFFATAIWVFVLFVGDEREYFIFIIYIFCCFVYILGLNYSPFNTEVIGRGGAIGYIQYFLIFLVFPIIFVLAPLFMISDLESEEIQFSPWVEATFENSEINRDGTFTGRLSLKNGTRQRLAIKKSNATFSAALPVSFLQLDLLDPQSRTINVIRFSTEDDSVLYIPAGSIEWLELSLKVVNSGDCHQCVFGLNIIFSFHLGAFSPEPVAGDLPVIQAMYGITRFPARSDVPVVGIFCRFKPIEKFDTETGVHWPIAVTSNCTFIPAIPRP